MQPLSHEEMMVLQMRKLRRELRMLRYSIIASGIAISAVISLGAPAFGFVIVATGMVVILYSIARGAKLLVDGWDLVSMRWHRAKWQAERNKGIEDEP